MLNIINKILKPFKRKTETPAIKTPDEKIAELTNELIEELKATGRSIGKDPGANKGFGALYLFVHHLGDEDSVMELSSGGWEIEIKPTFTEF